MRESKGNEVVREKLPKIIDYFVKVYGEEYRGRIEDRLYNTIFIFSDTDKKGRLYDEEKLIDVDELIGGDIVFGYLKDAKLAGVDAAGDITLAYYDEPHTPINVCVLPKFSECNDAVFIHECGHIIESDVKLDGKDFVTHTGFMLSRYKVDLNRRITRENNKGEDDVQREQLDYLNEVINDYITLQVVDAMKKDGFKVFENENTSSLYSLAFPALQDFIDRVSKTLIKDGFKGRMKTLPMLIGQDQFTKFLDDLHFLFKKYGNQRVEIERFLKKNNLSAYGLMREKDISWLPENIKGYIELCIEIENDIGDRITNELILSPRDSDDEREM